MDGWIDAAVVEEQKGDRVGEEKKERRSLVSDVCCN